MKFKPNQKYKTISFYAVITFSVCLLILIMFFKFSILQVYLNKLLKITAPVIWGVVIAYLLSPIQRVIEKYVSKLTNRKKPRNKLSRVVSITITLTLFIMAFVAIIANIVPEVISSINSIFSNIQNYFDAVKNYVERKFVRFNDANPEIKDFIYSEMDDFESVLMSMVDTLKPQLENIFSKDGPLANVTGSAWSFIVGIKNFFIGLVVSVYLLFNKERFCARLKQLVFAIFEEKKSMRILHICGEANKVFLSFLSGKALDSLIIGILCSIAMTILDLPYIALISVVIGVTNMIPFFGPLIGAIPTGFLILLSSPKKALVFAIMILILQQLDGNVIGPKILGNQLGINAFWILFSIIIGGGMFGFIGMLFAVPVFAVIRPLMLEFINNSLMKKNLSTDMKDYICNESASPPVDGEAKPEKESVVRTDGEAETHSVPDASDEDEKNTAENLNDKN
ncbi:MAG: AI-2E family transporter [Oscillospiraceae bacterium]|nr:AI-2E family transporter [Oscillospiraceae bacterium]